ncbi:thioesterase domain-containing protein [Methylosinus sp. LW4]|uniref:thioesterase domain-containing protein n=1 Tax=Methylosinus sp. LW4 TaxID=136993 RepID=UPI0003A5259B|nr:thioesterase domain-containing protein [Methylosinus sp. LW4]
MSSSTLVAATAIPAPPAPPNGPSDWSTAVRGNAFSNIERLGQWVGGTMLPSYNDPSSSFASVAPGSLGAGTTPPTIYVLIHGWAPTYRSIVDKYNGAVLWWGANAALGGVWTSDWAWLPSSAPSAPINSLGVLQSIVQRDPNAVVLAYSWIDDSATEKGFDGYQDVYQSEAYTHVNGLRLADALEQAIAPSFWNAHTGLLRLIGHSHGSKVATVAALTLQQRGRRVAHLTILDSPESTTPLEANGANLLGFHLDQLQIENPSYSCAAGAFVDNYASYFGVAYQGGGDIGNIVEVALQPSELYFSDPGDEHAYAATWYGGAAIGASQNNEPPLGLAWPPAPKSFLPSLNQNWPGGANAYSQWNLQVGPSIGTTYAYSTQALPITLVDFGGNVRFDPNGGGRIYLWPAPSRYPAFSYFQGSYDNSDFGDGYGLAFDLQWIAPQPGDYLVVTAESPVLGDQEVILVIDGASAPLGVTPVATSSKAGGDGLNFYVYFLAAANNTTGRVALSNFRLVEVTDPTGALRARRIAAAEVKAQAAEKADREAAS